MRDESLRNVCMKKLAKRVNSENEENENKNRERKEVRNEENNKIRN